MNAMYHVHVNNYQIETDPEKIFRLEMITNSGEDTFSLLKYVGGDPKLFSGMGIDDQGRLFRKKHGWWFSDDSKRTESDFGLADEPWRAFRGWKKKQKYCTRLAARFEMSSENSLPVVAGYTSETEIIRFKGVDGELSFKMYFTGVGQRERFPNTFENLA
jgi:hypothetical protein